MKLAVFGHYDSRGGTTAIPLPDNPTEADVRAAMRRYDLEMFGIDQPGDRITRTVYGMPARVADQMVHELMHGDELPSEEEFMFVAELHGADGMEGADLEIEGSVLLEEGTDWDEKKLAVDETIAMSIENPTQLEFVPTRPTYPDSEEGQRADENRIKGLAQILKNPQYRCWDDDAFGFQILERVNGRS
jgi:hypothetical protein